MDSNEYDPGSFGHKRMTQNTSSPTIVDSQMSPTKERSVHSKPNQQFQASCPSNDQTSSKKFASPDVASKIAAPRFIAKEAENAMKDSCSSPADKPLPSLPIATIITGSPVWVRRSLIDAQEKPLRKSLSPEQAKFEDWPSLSPVKQRSNNAPEKATGMVKPSISESLVERIQKLDINDSAARTKGQAIQSTDTTTLLSSNSSEATARQLPRKHVLKSSTLPVRQNKTSNLRSRLVPRAVTVKDEQPASPMPVAAKVFDTVDNNTQSAKGRNENSRHQAVHRARSRSRSRHRITAQGSPYLLPSTVPKYDRGRPSSLSLDPQKIDVRFGSEELGSEDSHSTINTSSPYKEHVDSRIKGVLPTFSTSPSSTMEKKNQDVSNPKSHSSVQSVLAQDNAGGGLDLCVNDKLQVYVKSMDPQLKACPANACTAEHDPSPAIVCTPEHSANANKGSMGEYQQYTTLCHDDFHDGHCELDESIDSVVEELDRAASESKSALKAGSTVDKLPFEVAIRAKWQSNGTTNTGSGLSCKPAKSELYLQHQKVHPLDEIDTKGQDKRSQTPLTATTIQIPNSSQSTELRLSDATHRKFCNLQRLSKDSAASVASVEETDTTKGTCDNPALHATDFEPKRSNGASDDTASFSRKSKNVPFDARTTYERDVPRSFLDLTSDDSGSIANQMKNDKIDSARKRYNVGEALAEIQPLSTPKNHKIVQARAEPQLRNASVSEVVTPALPRTSSLPKAARITGLRTPSSRLPVPVATETPAKLETATQQSKSVPRLRYVKSLIKSTSNSSHTKGINENNNDDPGHSPKPNVLSRSSSKTVLRNIRGLLHKRSKLQPSAHSSLSHVRQDATDHNTPKKQPANASCFGPPVIDRSARPPKSGVTPSATRNERTTSKTTPQKFPTNRIIRPFVDDSGPSAETSICLTNSESLTNKNERAKLGTGDDDRAEPTVTDSAIEPTEMQIATKTVYRILDIVQRDGSDIDQNRNLLELSKILVSILRTAREAQQALEEAKIAASKCEMRFVEIRRDINTANELAALILDQQAVDIEGDA